MSDDALPERLNRATVYKLLEYLLDNNLLTRNSIEGMDQYFEGLENIIEDSRREQKEKFIKYLEYVLSTYEFDDQDLTDSIKRTIEELK